MPLTLATLTRAWPLAAGLLFGTSALLLLAPAGFLMTTAATAVLLRRNSAIAGRGFNF